MHKVGVLYVGDRIITACKQDGFSTPEFRYVPGKSYDPEPPQKRQENTILELIKENPYIQRKELVRRLGIHESSVKRRLASLQEKGTIRHIGPNKGGYYS